MSQDRRLAAQSGSNTGDTSSSPGVWDVPQLGLPGPELELVVQRGDQTLGRFVLRPTPGYPVSFQRRVVAVTLADQVGAVLPQLRLV